MYASCLPAGLCKFPEKAVNNLQCSSKVEIFVTAFQQTVRNAETGFLAQQTVSPAISAQGASKLCNHCFPQTQI